VLAVSAIVSEERSLDRSASPTPPRPAVSIKNVSKSFSLPHHQYRILKERALHPSHARAFDVLEASSGAVLRSEVASS
jgi:hypothetical protein